jgi:rhamnopyranosyl-N-acetylglucosaminyl-diphospho-decaprenol beta-1,3/1,4-galactofuranosyltransferase
MKVAAVVVHYKDPAAALGCLAFLRAQTHPPDAIVVIDNSDTFPVEKDAVRVDIAGWPVDRHQAHDVVVIRPGGNIGPGPAFQLGFRFLASQYDGVWFLDQDMAPTPTCLENLINVLSRHGDRAAVAVPRRIDAQTRRVYRNAAWESRRIRRYVAGDESEIDMAVFSGLLVGTATAAATCFPEGYFIDADDLTFCMRLRRAGTVIVAAPSALTFHSTGRMRRLLALGPSLMVSADFRYYYQARNALALFREFSSGRLETALHYLAYVGPQVGMALLVGPRRLSKLGNSWRGFRDGLKRVSGVRPARANGHPVDAVDAKAFR